MNEKTGRSKGRKELKNDGERAHKFKKVTRVNYIRPKF